MEDFGYYRHGDLSPEALQAIQIAKDAATREISDFTVSFVSQQMTLGSGTLITVQGLSGVLTAYHVAKILNTRNEAFGIVISEQVHQFLWELDWVEIIPVGVPLDSSQPERGPDLAFIRLLDLQRLGTLRSKKSFYRLDGRSFAEWEQFPFQQMPWWVAGAPAEFSTSSGTRGSSDHILSATHFHGEADFQSFENRGDFDFIRLNVTAGVHNFPLDYGGVSGGGIWLAPLVLDPTIGTSTIKKQSPFLVGTAFFQGPEDTGHRCIVGHGPRSIYMRLPEILATRQIT